MNCIIFATAYLILTTHTPPIPFPSMESCLIAKEQLEGNNNNYRCILGK